MTNPKYAYATLVMLGDVYVPGALVLGHSLQQVSSPAIDKIVMVTSDVSKNARKQLKKIFMVIEVPLVKFNSRPFLIFTPEQKQRYESWISTSYTKWQILSLTKYSKIFFLDADTIVLKNIDAIFEFDTPAGVFTNPWSITYKQGGFMNPYVKIKPGEKIPNSIIKKAFESRSSVVVGSSVLLSPNSDDHMGILDMLNSNIPFGFDVHSGNDEQAITYYYSLIGKEWTLLPPSLNTIPWYLELIKPDKTIDEKNNDGKENLTKKEILNSKVPLVIHYFGSIHIWDMDPWDPKIWPDIFVWFQLAINFICKSSHKPHEISELKKMFNITKRICKNNIKLPERCFYCEWLINEGPKYNWYVENLDPNHAVINEHNELICPQML